jgi:four helix bundle protein
MPLIKRFEDVQAWQEARLLTQQIYTLTQSGASAKDFGLKDQIQRVTVSVMANIAEGFDCGSKAEFIRFLGIARRSAVKVQSLHYAALDIGYITEDIFKFYYAQADKTKALVGGFMHSLKSRQVT